MIARLGHKVSVSGRRLPPSMTAIISKFRVLNERDYQCCSSLYQQSERAVAN